MHRLLTIAAAFYIFSSPAAAAEYTSADQAPPAAQQTAPPAQQPVPEALSANPDSQAAQTPVPPPFPPMPSARPSHRWVDIGARSGRTYHRSRHVHQRPKSARHRTARVRGKSATQMCHAARHGHSRRHNLCAAPVRHGHRVAVHRHGRTRHRHDTMRSRSATHRDRPRHPHGRRSS